MFICDSSEEFSGALIGQGELAQTQEMITGILEVEGKEEDYLGRRKIKKSVISCPLQDWQ